MMAVAATMMGGITGFVSFLISLLALDQSFAASCGIYFATGFLTVAVILIASCLPRRSHPEARIAQDITVARAG